MQAASATIGSAKAECETSSPPELQSNSSFPLSRATLDYPLDSSALQPPSNSSTPQILGERRKVVVVGGPTSWFAYNPGRPWLAYSVEVNVLWWVVVIAAFVIRFWRIDFPRYVMCVNMLPALTKYQSRWF